MKQQSRDRLEVELKKKDERILEGKENNHIVNVDRVQGARIKQKKTPGMQGNIRQGRDNLGHCHDKRNKERGTNRTRQRTSKR